MKLFAYCLPRFPFLSLALQISRPTLHISRFSRFSRSFAGFVIQTPSALCLLPTAFRFATMRPSDYHPTQLSHYRTTALPSY